VKKQKQMFLDLGQLPPPVMMVLVRGPTRIKYQGQEWVVGEVSVTASRTPEGWRVSPNRSGP
jgi:hypothetical protein